MTKGCANSLTIPELSESDTWARMIRSLPRGGEMKAYRIERFGSVDGIELRSSDDPRPRLREVLMRVRASSLNYRDLMVLKGGGRGPTKLGVIPLSDGAGEVAAVGDGVTRVKVGDRIAGCFHPRWFGGPIRSEYLTDRLGANLDGMLASRHPTMSRLAKEGRCPPRATSGGELKIYARPIGCLLPHFGHSRLSETPQPTLAEPRTFHSADGRTIHPLPRPDRGGTPPGSPQARR